MGEVEATTVGLCDGVRKKRNDIDQLPQIIMIHVADTDLMRGEGRCREEGRGEDNHHGDVIKGSHLGASPLNSHNLT